MKIFEDTNRHAVLVAMRAGRSAEEISEFLGIPLTTVNMLMQGLEAQLGGGHKV